jgi:hypothetical protein
MKISRTTIALSIGLAGLLLGGCKKDSIDTIKNQGFDIDSFSANLTEGFEGKTVGYSFSISQDGKVLRTGAGGNARLAIDAPATDYLVSTRQGIGSCSKTITAYATLKALEAKGLDEKAKIIDFLPTGWVLADANKDIRFEDVLSHKAGLTNFGGDWAALKKMVETPTTGIGAYDYDNANYTLCRLLCAYLVEKRSDIESGFDPDFLTCTMFLNYVRSDVFKPAGLQQWEKIEIGPWDENASPTGGMPADMTLYYNYSQPTLNGVTRWTTIFEAGPGGFYMNSYEVAQVIAAGEQGKIVSADMMKRMKEKKMGYDNEISGDHGAYVWKNGVWDDGAPGRGIYTVVMHFPNNVQIAWQTNARQTNIGGPEGVIATAFDNAWY